MATYIYLPVPTTEMVDMAESMASAINMPKINILANKYEKGVGKSMYRWVNKCLSDLKSTDTLYILLHGTGGSDSTFVGAERGTTFGGTEWKKYTPSQLSTTLGKEGLPSTFVNLHICACGSGYDGDKLSPWAKRLKEQMVKTYKSVQVTGYLGWFSITGSTIRIKDPVNYSFHDLHEKAVTF